MITFDVQLHPRDAGRAFQVAGDRVTRGLCWNSEMEGPKAGTPVTEASWSQAGCI